jgi:hypothetical protein
MTTKPADGRTPSISGPESPWRIARSATTWHYASLLIGLVVILCLQQGQWFFFDEWDFLKLSGPGLFTPHVGHWSTSPMLVFIALRDLVGLHSYFAYAALVTVFHLLAAHLIWRIAGRSGANGWISTSLVTVFIFLGAGAENILWAFQIGFIGAMVLGLLALYLASSPRLSRGRFIVVILISLFSLTWSGTALPILVATAFVLWRVHGWRRAAVHFAINLAAYLVWYLLFAFNSPSNPPTGGFGLHKVFVQMPEFIGVMLILGFQQVFPLFALGSAVLIALLIWLITTFVRRKRLSAMLPALALGGAAAIFAIITAYSRAASSIGAGQSSRYIYTVVLLLLPLFAVALSQLARNRVTVLVPICVLVLALAGYQAVQLGSAAAAQSKTEQGSRQLISACLYLYIEHAPGLNLAAGPDPRWAPDIEMKDLVALYKAHDISVSHFTKSDLAKAKKEILTGR